MKMGWGWGCCNHPKPNDSSRHHLGGIAAGNLRKVQVAAKAHANRTKGLGNE
jgi:hypothetical protein